MIDLNKLLEDLTSDDIIRIVTSLGADRYEDKTDYIVFPTICHNITAEDASMKLYYYKDTKLFHCYTDCSASFNLYTLIDKVFSLHGREKVKSAHEKKSDTDYTFFDLVKYITNQSDITTDFSEFSSEKYMSERDKFKRKKRTIDLPVYSKNILNIFDKMYPAEWLQDGISKEAMDLYDIRYSISRNKIIIPHYDINNELIGIRGRALNQDEIDLYGKYMPVEIEGKWYKHPLSQNLYGLYISQSAIRESKKVIIFEGEKSCLLAQGYLGNKNNSVACCGSSINKAQIDLLMKTCAPEEIIIAFDKEFQDYFSAQADKYFEKLYNMGKKYANYANFSFLIDKENLLDLKDSPIDKGFDTFEKIYRNRVIIK